MCSFILVWLVLCPFYVGVVGILLVWLGLGGYFVGMVDVVLVFSVCIFSSVLVLLVLCWYS